MARNARRTEIEKMEDDIRKFTKRAAGEDSDEEQTKKKVKKSFLEAELSKYSKGRGLQKKGKGRKDETDVLAALDSFRGRLQGFMAVGNDIEGGESKGSDGLEGAGEEEGMEVDNDTDFLNHALSFPKDNTEETNKAERDYEVIDPRQRGARAREEERERKQRENNRKGGRYRR